ncbi:hypothetical protein M514_08737 [Trichuris suis]|uniref:Uncharacterized protein n=1 Tax=Trichuris suis TaxID=68888 RepID=A0A085N7D5_9BILA|nr:hypothetical protein M513_08737 [Trichuris suis]KFD65381.1 hypothetical protein M514_08737 [Trichuris suis]
MDRVSTELHDYGGFDCFRYGLSGVYCTWTPGADEKRYFPAHSKKRKPLHSSYPSFSVDGNSGTYFPWLFPSYPIRRFHSSGNFHTRVAKENSMAAGWDYSRLVTADFRDSSCLVSTGLKHVGCAPVRIHNEATKRLAEKSTRRESQCQIKFKVFKHAEEAVRYKRGYYSLSTGEETQTCRCASDVVKSYY